jgi:deoxyribonuclease V
MWPPDPEALVARQRELATAEPVPWLRRDTDPLVGGCWVCFPRGYAGPGASGDPAWSAAVMTRGADLVVQRVGTDVARSPYVPGLLALRVGPLLEAVVRLLPHLPDVLLVDGTGRDHPRRAGLALHLGAEVGLPTVGLTHRPLLAVGEWPLDRRGATSLLRVGDEVVGCWVRTQHGVRPIAVHPGWRVDLETAVDVVLRSAPHARTPEPLRRARHAAREARSRAAGSTAGASGTDAGHWPVRPSIRSRSRSA